MNKSDLHRIIKEEIEKLAGIITENNNDYNLEASKDPSAVFGLFRYSDEEKKYFQDVINLLTGRADFNAIQPNYNLSDLVKELNKSIEPNDLWQVLSKAYKKNMISTKAADILFDKLPNTPLTYFQ